VIDFNSFIPPSSLPLSFTEQLSRREDTASNPLDAVPRELELEDRLRQSRSQPGRDLLAEEIFFREHLGVLLQIRQLEDVRLGEQSHDAVELERGEEEEGEDLRSLTTFLLTTSEEGERVKWSRLETISLAG
jgi:hypothetical protein